MFFTNNIKPTKKVTFMNLIRVVLIPKYQDICDCREIWWSEIDKMNATIFMHNEINTILRINPTMNKSQAMKLLYQPENNCATPVNYYQI
jgi:hypothetical protein